MLFEGPNGTFPLMTGKRGGGNGKRPVPAVIHKISVEAFPAAEADGEYVLRAAAEADGAGAFHVSAEVAGDGDDPHIRSRWLQTVRAEPEMRAAAESAGSGSVCRMKG